MESGDFGVSRHRSASDKGNQPKLLFISKATQANGVGQDEDQGSNGRAAVGRSVSQFCRSQKEGEEAEIDEVQCQQRQPRMCCTCCFVCVPACSEGSQETDVHVWL